MSYENTINQNIPKIKHYGENQQNMDRKKTRGRNSDTSRGRDLHVSKHATLVGVLGVDG